jgi:hypothetical protein
VTVGSCTERTLSKIGRETWVRFENFLANYPILTERVLSNPLATANKFACSVVSTHKTNSGTPLMAVLFKISRRLRLSVAADVSSHASLPHFIVCCWHCLINNRDICCIFTLFACRLN